MAIDYHDPQVGIDMYKDEIWKTAIPYVFDIIDRYAPISLEDIWTRFYERYGLVASGYDLAFACGALLARNSVVWEKNTEGEAYFFPADFPDCEERTIGEMAEAYERLLREIPQRDTIEVDLPDF